MITRNHPLPEPLPVAAPLRLLLVLALAASLALAPAFAPTAGAATAPGGAGATPDDDVLTGTPARTTSTPWAGATSCRASPRRTPSRAVLARTP